jgi:hypothetical protein
MVSPELTNKQNLKENYSNRNHSNSKTSGKSFNDFRQTSTLQAKIIDGINNSAKNESQRNSFEKTFSDSTSQLKAKDDTAQLIPELEEEDLMQGKFKQKPVQLMPELEEENFMQGKFK